MSPLYLIKTLVVLAAVGYLAITESEARSLNQLTTDPKGSQASALDQALLDQSARASLDQLDVNDDDDDDKIQPQNPLSGDGTNLFYNQPIVAEQTNLKYQAAPATDLKTSASHHHHGHGVKGWLDMGAWTGKKGAFGWYDKHPVGGKGK